MKMFFIKLTFFAVYGLIRRRRFDLSDDDPRELNMVVELVEFMWRIPFSGSGDRGVDSKKRREALNARESRRTHGRI